MTCPNCQWQPEPGADWGYLESVTWDACEHSAAYRECRSCSMKWHRPGMEPAFDYDLVGDPPEYKGGADSEDCPACVAFDAEDERADLETKLEAALGGK